MSLSNFLNQTVNVTLTDSSYVYGTLTEVDDVLNIIYVEYSTKGKHIPLTAVRAIEVQNQ
ncbi:LSM domain-containing protein [Alkalihalobacillus sp. AL-G]|uniref:LSM domain-containing protein n=1 Tax=Alkalihalobacillus sp. AL-G TaxID=2926399 RepID=UPI00272DA8AC|nr:LSM domain-containing protein [Alkalihalobacillus sp. AL-G]WLD92647.1 hypothetical protein MOJ78_16755 [Alkalihalobacillus sp. AL-G]